jgi:hypothetical protein
VLQIVYGKVMLAVEAHQIVLIPLMVTEKEVLAVHTAIILPPPLSLLYHLALWVVIVTKRNPMLP